MPACDNLLLICAHAKRKEQVSKISISMNVSLLSKSTVIDIA